MKKELLSHNEFMKMCMFCMNYFNIHSFTLSQTFRSIKLEIALIYEFKYRIRVAIALLNELRFLTNIALIFKLLLVYNSYNLKFAL